MSFNVGSSQQSPIAQIPIAVFGSLVTEIEAANLPLGVSPDNQDVIYVPGSVASRPGLQKVFTTPWGTASTTYAKSYVDPVGVIRNLYLDSAGSIWVENLTAAPGVYTRLAFTTHGSYAKSITAFGREYIAVSDGLHGQEVPLQYDGTYLDRCTQDGPGAPPNVVSFALPSSQMAVSGAPATLTVNEADPTGGDYSTYYTGINLFVSSVGPTQVGDSIAVSGNTSSVMNQTGTVTAIYDSGTSAQSLIILSVPTYPAPAAYGTGGIATIGSGTTLRRSNNVVTVQTSTPHGLQVGYQAQISGVVASTVGGSISSIVINNEDNPGLATVTTSSAHGLLPGLFVSLLNIPGTAVGGWITSAVREGDLVTVSTSSAHNLSPGSSVTVSGTTDVSFSGTFIVQQVPTSTSLTYGQVDADATTSGGTLTQNWPIPVSTTPSYFQVETAPTSTSFTVAINYSDGTWSGGRVTYAWDGRFFVNQVVSPTIFQYTQYGPNAISSTVGTVTPYGQAAPGMKQLRVSFLTRQGYLTAPSPPVSFVANGGQYVSVTNIPIGPANVVARILQFTGSGGSYFFYIPVPAVENGQQVSTATQINDNTATTAVVDFSDNTLFASIDVSKPGNAIANQIVLDSVLGFASFAGRLVAYGSRNRINNLLNMGFDGGAFPSSPNLPTGWTPFGTYGSGALAGGHYGQGWLMTAASSGNGGGLFQSFSLDAYGAPIATPNTLYTLRVWVKSFAYVPGLMLTVSITGPGGYSSGATISGAMMSTDGSWLEAAFQSPTPSSTANLNLNVYVTSNAVGVILIDDISILYAEAPYLDTVAYGSYVNNPEAIDGVTGKFGSADDTRKQMDFGLIRGDPYFLTQEPSGQLRQIVVNGVTEPAGWDVFSVGTNCGALSTFSMTRSQADNSTGSGGEQWFAWGSATGARIFGGSQPWKISQEIQPDWGAINPAAAKTVWALNDPVLRVIYFGLPVAGHSAPSLIYPLNYRELDTPEQIFAGSPVRISGTGRVSATDNARKWTRWNLPMNGAALMYRAPGALSVVFFGGNGSAPVDTGAFGNVYTLNAAKLTDDDYGMIAPYYVTFAFPQPDEEQGLGLGSTRKQVEYTTANVAGVGIMHITLLVNTLTNPWPLTGDRTLALDPKFDLEWPGGNCVGNRIFAKYASLPLSGTDNGFNLKRVMIAMKIDPSMQVRGAAQ